MVEGGGGGASRGKIFSSFHALSTPMAVNISMQMFIYNACLTNTPPVCINCAEEEETSDGGLESAETSHWREERAPPAGEDGIFFPAVKTRPESFGLILHFFSSRKLRVFPRARARGLETSAGGFISRRALGQKRPVEDGSEALWKWDDFFL